MSSSFPPYPPTDTFLEELLSLQHPQHVRVSPSGTQIVYTTTLHLGHKTGEHAQSTLWLAEPGKPDSARQLSSGLFNDESPQWSPDGSRIAFLSDRAKPGKSCAIYLLSMLHHPRGEAFPLTPVENERRIAQFCWRPDGKFIAYLGADEQSPAQKAREDAKDDALVWGVQWEEQRNRLRVVHVPTKTVQLLLKSSHQQRHVCEIAWNDEGSTLAFTAQRTPELESAWDDGTSLEFVDFADAENATATVVCEAMCSMRGISWVKNAIFFVSGATPESKMTSSTLYSVATDKGNGVWEKRAGGQVDCVKGFAKCGDTVLVYASCGLHSEIRTLDGEVLVREMTEFTAWDATRSKKGIVVAVTKSSVSAPTEVFSWEQTTLAPSAEPEMKQVSIHGQGFEAQQAELTTLSVKSLDGKVMLDGLFLAPNKKSWKPWPTFVMPHGGPYSRTTASFMPGYGWAPYLLSAGYAVIYTNYRGGSGHGEEFAAWARGGMGTVEYDDVIALTQSCIERGIADKKTVIVGGWSQGGFLSYVSAVRNGTHGMGWKFRGAICGAGITDWDTMASTSDLPGFESELGGLAPWSADKGNVQARRGSPIWEMAEAAKAGRIPPVLILHGEKDVRVPISQAWGFYRGCKRWGVACEMVTYPREDHVFAERKHLVDMFQRVRRFCDRHSHGEHVVGWID